MKVLLGLVPLIAFAVAPAFAGQGHVSSHSLAKMGLAGLTTMTDAQGMHIRGLSVSVGGGSIAFINGVGGGASSVNFYSANGRNSASGDNSSVAGDITTTTTTHGNHVMTTSTVNTIGAGGFSSASAK